MGRRSSLVLAAVLAVLGFLLVTAVFSTSRLRRQAAPRKARLVAQIEDRRDRVTDLDRQVRDLRARVATAERDTARRTQLDRQQAADAVRLADLAGTTPLKGKGLTVRLSDSDRRPSGTADAGAFRIHDTDVQLVVNALFDAGAEAAAVNGSRLVATTPIRAAGGTIVVNFRPLDPPYRVVAIGADPDRFGSSDVAKRFKRWTRLFGLGFNVTEGTVTVPAYTGRVAITTAQPAGD